MFRRPPALKQKKPNLSNVDDDNEESDDSLPFAKAPTGQREDPSATLRDTPPTELSSRARSGTAGGTRPTRDNVLKQQEKDVAEPSAKSKGKQPVHIATKMESSASSASSAAPTTNTTGDAMVTSTGQHKRIDALSPRRRAELARLSPRSRGRKGRDGSDGTPSMGSSFSDLDGTFLSSLLLSTSCLLFCELCC